MKFYIFLRNTIRTIIRKLLFSMSLADILLPTYVSEFLIERSVHPASTIYDN